MAMVESLHCPNCGAPLPHQSLQTLAACMYCNSTIRIALGAAPEARPRVTRAAEVPPDTIDEVKRLLLLRQHAPAVSYYAQAAQVDPAAAELAVKGIERTMAYFPPLSAGGVALLAAFEVVGSVGLLGGVLLLQRGALLAGGLVLAASALFSFANLWVLGRGLPGFLLSRSGHPAPAQVLKTWLIRTDQVQGQPVALTRLLLEVRPEGGAPYRAEANIYVREASQAKFAPGAQVRVKYDPHAPARVVVEGPVAA